MENRYSYKRDYKKLTIQILITIGLALIADKVLLDYFFENEKNEHIKEYQSEIRSNHQEVKELEGYENFVYAIFDDKKIDEIESERLYEIENKLDNLQKEETDYERRHSISSAAFNLKAGEDFGEIVKQIESIEPKYSDLSVAKMRHDTIELFEVWYDHYKRKTENIKEEMSSEHDIENIARILIYFLAVTFIFLCAHIVYEIEEPNESDESTRY